MTDPQQQQQKQLEPDNANTYQAKRPVYLSLILFYFIFQLGDIVTTKFGLMLGAQEGNMFVAPMFDAGLIQIATMYKLLTALLLVTVFILWSDKLNMLKYYTVYISFLIMSIVVLNNSIHIIRYLYYI